MAHLLEFFAQSRIDAPAEELFRWHADPAALERLTPPWEPIEILQAAPGIQNGDRGTLQVHLGPLRIRWVFEHCDYVEGRQFRDIQISGPFRYWDHIHKMEPQGVGACMLTDHIRYELPLGFAGKLLAGWFVCRKLTRMFKYRHQVTAEAMRARGKS